MADSISKEKRSELMKSIRSMDTKPEIKVRSFLFNKGFRYRLHKKGLPGNPDIVLPKYNSIVFVHGCFWHGHACKIGSGNRKPKSNKEFWLEKLTKNIDRDKRNQGALKELGWKVFVVWECETMDETILKEVLGDLLKKQ